MDHSNVADSPAAAVAATAARSKVRYYILAMLFIVTAINVGDRATLSITGTALTQVLGINSITLGYIFSAFAWAYVLGQLPGGWLLDKFGSARVYGVSLFLWSTITVAQGMIGFFSVSVAVAMLFVLRFLLGLIEAPVYPANNRIVAAWFPLQERGLATVIYNSSMYLSVVMLAPLMGFIAHTYGWEHVYWFMGGLGIVVSLIWFKLVKGPTEHPLVNAAELEHIRSGGADVDMDKPKAKDAFRPKFSDLKVLLKSPMMWSIYLGKYCDTSLQYFFLTWFPIYLVKGRGLNIMEAGAIAAIPGICGLLGALCGGTICDVLLRRGVSLTVARKIPLVCGMSMGATLVLCNFTDSVWVVTLLMSMAIFGKGVVAVDWTLVSDTAPKQITGMAGGLFNMFGNISGIFTPIIIGYIVQATGSFEGALYVVAGHALLGALAFLSMGRLHRLELARAN
ncbi:ACS family glucarate transporter-like MFS transporter [Pseudomonas sp. JUb42]|uniref:MFS transporter n=1 Tax=Pseudomonas sp. JUb42 TaxID=2940611 RepID=UPI0038F6533F|nr:ACS family glucarate transporter-like MFS transporter [Pseudomonas sp. JUb42]